MGAQPRICLGDPEMVKQVLSSNFGFYLKPYPGPNIMALLGKGLVLAEGSDWARHRRALNPAFHIDKLKVFLTTLCFFFFSDDDSYIYVNLITNQTLMYIHVY